jgi:predicted nicotinamide N-methyase
MTTWENRRWQAGPPAARRADRRPEVVRAAMVAAGAVGLRALRSGGKIEEIVEEVR